MFTTGIHRARNLTISREEVRGEGRRDHDRIRIQGETDGGERVSICFFIAPGQPLHCGDLPKGGLWGAGGQ